MSIRTVTVVTILAASGIAAMTHAERQPQAPSKSPHTRVALLGTGTPAANPDRSGPATAVVVNDTAYLVDFGPGVVRRANAAAIGRGIAALQPTRLHVAFVTHLHSDHTVGYPDLIFSPWTLGRRTPLEVYGPKGLKAMTEHLIAAYRVDVETRTNADGNQRTFQDGYKVNAHEIGEGIVYKDARFSEKYHTTTEQLADLAHQAKPRLLILYHHNSVSPEELQADMMRRYTGHFVIGRDLDVY